MKIKVNENVLLQNVWSLVLGNRDLWRCLRRPVRPDSAVYWKCDVWISSRCPSEEGGTDWELWQLPVTWSWTGNRRPFWYHYNKSLAHPVSKFLALSPSACGTFMGRSLSGHPQGPKFAAHDTWDHHPFLCPRVCFGCGPGRMCRCTGGCTVTSIDKRFCSKRFQNNMLLQIVIIQNWILKKWLLGKWL